MTDHTAIQETNEMKQQWAKHIKQGAPKREWVGLTELEINHYNSRLSGSGVAEEIQAKLRERNT